MLAARRSSAWACRRNSGTSGSARPGPGGDGVGPLAQLREEADRVLQGIAELVREAGGQAAGRDQLLVPEDREPGDLEVVVRPGVRQGEGGLVGERLDQLLVGVRERPARSSPVTATSAQRRLARPDRHGEHGAGVAGRLRPVRTPARRGAGRWSDPGSRGSGRCAGRARRCGGAAGRSAPRRSPAGLGHRDRHAAAGVPDGGVRRRARARRPPGPDARTTASTLRLWVSDPASRDSSEAPCCRRAASLACWARARTGAARAASASTSRTSSAS